MKPRRRWSDLVKEMRCAGSARRLRLWGPSLWAHQVTAVGHEQWPGGRQADIGSTVDASADCPRRGRKRSKTWVRASVGMPTPLSVTRTTADVVLVSHRDLDPVAAHQGVARQVVQDLPDAGGIHVDAGRTVWACASGVVGVPGCSWPSRSGRGPGGSATVGCGFLGVRGLRDVGGQGGQPLVLPYQDRCCGVKVDHRPAVLRGDLVAASGAQLMAQVGEHASSGLLRGAIWLATWLKASATWASSGWPRSSWQVGRSVRRRHVGRRPRGLRPARPIPVEDGGDPESGEHRGARPTASDAGPRRGTPAGRARRHRGWAWLEHVHPEPCRADQQCRRTVVATIAATTVDS